MYNIGAELTSTRYTDMCSAPVPQYEYLLFVKVSAYFRNAFSKNVQQ